MSNKNGNGVPFAGEGASEEQLWNTLEQLPKETPSQQLRQGFYRKLDRLSAPKVPDRIRSWLGFSNNAGWLTATVCLVLGLVMGRVLQDSTITDGTRLAALEQQVSTLNRTLILDRLDNASPSKRLRGVIDAVGVAAHDDEIAGALLTRAVEDRVHSVRSAAIDALGPQLSQPSVGDELMKSLEETDSPLVQLTLVDLVLRYGSNAQLERLVKLAEEGRLHPDLIKHVENSVGRNQV